MRLVKRSRRFGKQEIAAAEMAEETNCLREKPCVLLIISLLLTASRRNHPSADHNATSVRPSPTEIKRADSVEIDSEGVPNKFMKVRSEFAAPDAEDTLPKNLVPKNGLFRYNFS